MNRLLTGTAVGLLLGLSPALAQSDIPADETQTPPAMEQPAPSDTAPEALPLEPSEPGEPIPDQSSEAPPSLDDAMPELPGAATLDDPVSPDEAIEDSAQLDHPTFATEQASDEWLASNLIGQSVVNSENESIARINDLVTDKDGKVVAVLVGYGGFLGIGAKDVALRFEDLDFIRNEDQSVQVVADLSQEMLASAPEYKRLHEQDITVGENVTDLEKDESIPREPGVY
jgi:hypothetical protein